MKIKLFITGVLSLVFLLVGVHQYAYANHGTVSSAQVTDPITVVNESPDPLAQKCSFNSDCAYGLCKGGQCGGCSFTSECKGWGTCKSGQCGGCSFNSECKGFGDCSSGKCTKSPY